MVAGKPENELKEVLNTTRLCGTTASWDLRTRYSNREHCTIVHITKKHVFPTRDTREDDSGDQTFLIVPQPVYI